MKTMTVLEFLEETGLDVEFEAMGYEILPLTIDDLLYFLDDAELNYWSYCVEDKDEIKTPSLTVLVRDITGQQRYFETAETITW